LPGITIGEQRRETPNKGANMNALAVSGLVVGCTFGGALFGMFLGADLGEPLRLKTKQPPHY